MTTVSYVWTGTNGEKQVFNSFPAVKEHVSKAGGRYEKVLTYVETFSETHAVGKTRKVPMAPRKFGR